MARVIVTPASNEKTFETWLNRTLSGAQFRIGRQEAEEEEKEVKDQVKDLEGEVSKILEEGGGGPEDSELAKLAEQDPEDLQKAAGELFSEIGSVLTGSITESLTDIKEAASSVVSSIPMLGTIVAGVKLLYQGVQVGLLVREAYKIYQAKADSFSLIEKEVLGAIQFFQKEKGAQLGKDMAATAATGAAAAFGGGGFVEVGKKLADLLMNIVIKIIHRYKIMKANKAFAQGNITLELLRSCPALGLHLPHLEGVDTLTLLGVLPPGWRDSDKAQNIRNKLAEIVVQGGGPLRSAELGWLVNSLKWDDPGSMYQSPDESGLGGAAGSAAYAPTRKERNPWHSEYRRIVYMLEKTDQYLNTQNWKLHKGRTLLYDPAPTSIIEKAKEKIKNVFTEPKATLRPIGKQG